MSAVSFGEVRHERCKFGRLTEAYLINPNGETPSSAPLCTFTPPDPVPPGLTRAWGGIIDVERDCAKCWCFAEVG